MRRRPSANRPPDTTSPEDNRRFLNALYGCVQWYHAGDALAPFVHCYRTAKALVQRRRISILIFAVATGVLLLVLHIVLHSGFLRILLHGGVSKQLEPTDLSHKEVLKLTERTTAAIQETTASERNVNGTVLAYVTPWNSRGYDMAKKYRTRFTHVSPVWYQLKRSEKGLYLTGRHDVDHDWILEVRKHGSPLIVPRFVVEGLSLEIMLVEREEKLKAIKLIIDECKEMLFDGIVFEAWTPWAAFRIFENHHLRQKAVEFVKELGTAMHKVRSPSSGRRLQLILVVPPLREDGWYHPEEFKGSDVDYLKQAVDSFSLMTYDYSHPHQPGPNAPLFWIRSSLNNLLPAKSSPLASKILLGINFYGNDFIIPKGGGPILGDQFLALVKEHEPKLVWDVVCREHYFEYTKDAKKHKVYYPTMNSISLRLEEVRVYGVGVSIWEIGQGLEEFFSLL